MDGRTVLCLAVGVLATASGCSLTTKSVLSPEASAEAMSQARAKGQPVVVAKSDDSSDRRPLRPSTCVAGGDFQASIVTDPETPGPQRDIAYNSARQAYGMALKLEPGYLPAHIGMARLHTAVENREQALESYRGALAVAPREAAVWYEFGMIQARFKDFDSAAESLRTAIQLDPQNRAYVKSLGFTLARNGRYEDALATLMQTMDEAEARCNLGRMLLHVNQPEAAAQQFQLALARNPNHEKTRELLDSMKDATAPAEKGAIQQAGHFTSAAGSTPQSSSSVTGISQAHYAASRSTQPTRAPIQIGFELD